MLKARLITACILIVLLALTIYFSSVTFFRILTLLLTVGGAFEWTNLMGIKRIFFRFVYMACVLLGLWFAFLLPTFWVLGIALIWWCVAFLLLVVHVRFLMWGKHVWLQALMGFLVLIPCWVALNYLKGLGDKGIYLLFFLFLLTSGADSAAYFTGKKWGKTHLAPLISPGKTVEGLVGALIIMFALICGILLLQGIDRRLFLPITAWCVLTILFSIVGDLFESLLKRQAGLKDSGTLLPGHGGLLDRIDSLTSAAPIFVLGVMLLVN